MGHRYVNNINFRNEDFFGQDDVTRLFVLDLQKVDLRLIANTDSNGNFQGITDKNSVENRPGYLAAINGSFYGIVPPGGPRAGSLEPYGDIYSEGRLYQPSSQQGRSVANHRYALAITQDNKAEVVLGGWKQEYRDKYKFFMGGLGLLTSPDSSLPKERFDLVASLINGNISQLPERDSRYLPLVRDQESACDVDNRRGAGVGQTREIQSGITSRTAVVITKTGQIVFVYLEDGLLPEEWEGKIKHAVRQQGFEAESILLTDSGARSRLFAREENNAETELFRKLEIAQNTPGLFYSTPTPPIAFLGAFER
ncbi:MAG: phosphodiester glycosidase family protein [Candidatus Caenarcaniphilales bacterium]|nr:phosphodiester glycosidase family protein [Candidatus Caenarcaniphilales bacterium]